MSGCTFPTQPRASGVSSCNQFSRRTRSGLRSSPTHFVCSLPTPSPTAEIGRWRRAELVRPPHTTPPSGNMLQCSPVARALPSNMLQCRVGGPERLRWSPALLPGLQRLVDASVMTLNCLRTCDFVLVRSVPPLRFPGPRLTNGECPALMGHRLGRGSALYTLPLAIFVLSPLLRSTSLVLI